MLKGKKVIIIGGTSGMGLEVARQVLAQGGEAVVVGRNADKVQQVVKQLGAAARGRTAHIGNPEELRAVFYQAGPFD
ncbi:MAG TPA: SDR family NAD(P)-dependent oxidoreductase, partial [Bacillota bacterium]|nr:SDR family NAD(P)-dependent oxidoreductase [Bacillota bacterium]